MRSEPEAGVVKQSGLGCEKVFEPIYLIGEAKAESRTSFAMPADSLLMCVGSSFLFANVPGAFGFRFVGTKWKSFLLTFVDAKV